VEHGAAAGNKNLHVPVKAYLMAEAIGGPLRQRRPMADWAFVKDNNADQLVCLWIALAYACGQRFMVPNRVALLFKGNRPGLVLRAFFNLFAAVRLYQKTCVPAQRFFPVGPLPVPECLPSSFETHEKRQRFAHALEKGNPSPIQAGEGAWVFPRCRKDGLNVAHVVNITYDDVRKKNIPRTNLKFRFRKTCSTAILIRPRCMPVDASRSRSRWKLPMGRFRLC